MATTPFTCPVLPAPDPAGAVILVGLAVQTCYGPWDQLTESAGVFDDSFDDIFE